ncbi:unnamed protein product [Fraxinus pennsylvanica]|uniref:DUF7963 domain-containing protein n=1 Tax=Fraxinus pennsylvanica TaxID=56036 RepID=A0AAD1ZZ32_9LAMI|nr:unnamed protein product [Fraxinus pennsylvanica]
MAAPNATTPPAVESTSASASLSSDEVAAKAVHKRYEGLMMVRNKAIKGKGAWYWAHLEPILVHNSETGFPKAVKLRCSLCAAAFSASNPSRTASEHLKKGTCPNFASVPIPISSAPSASVPVVSLAEGTTNTSQPHNHRKRSTNSSGDRGDGGKGRDGTEFSVQHVPPVAIVDPSRFKVELAYPPLISMASTSAVPVAGGTSGGGERMYGRQQEQRLVLSGGKEDLGALAMLEDSVKRLKSPKSSPGPTLTKSQVDSALDFLADWIYECCGSVSFSSLEHPKFKAFLNQVGLPSISRKDFMGSRLDAKYNKAKAESEAKIHDAMFFQIASDGWKSTEYGRDGEESFVNVAVNLPNGTSVFRRAVSASNYVQSKYAEEVLWETITEICGNSVHQCVGIVSDKFKAKAMRNLENQHHWMVNLCCQYQGFNSLIKDFSKELPLFKNVTENCLKLANFVNNKSQIRLSFRKYQLQEYGHAGLLRMPLRGYERSDFGPVYAMVEDILGSARALQLVLLDESYKMVLVEEPIARDIEEMMRNPHFWNELEAVHSLVKLVKTMAREILMEKPRVGQCLTLWEELRLKVKDWCSKFHIVGGPVEKVIDRRFRRNYHPAWAAAFILDPLYLFRDTSGKYLPPFKFLTPEQEKDVDKLITRLVSRDEAHIALMELMKWRTEGLDPVYAQAVQLKQRDSTTGKMKIANPQSSRLVWETHLTEFKSLGKAGIDRAQKLMFIAAHSKMETPGSSKDEDKDTELFALENEAFDGKVFRQPGAP